MMENNGTVNTTILKEPAVKKNRIIVQDLAKYLPAQIIPGIVGFFSGPLIAAMIDPGQYGNYVLARSVVRLATVVATWASIALVRVYPECETQGRLPVLQSTTLWMNLLTSLALCALGAVVLVFTNGRIDPGLHQMLWLCLPVLCTASCYDVFLQSMRCRRVLVWYSAMQSWQSLGGLGIGLGLLVLLGRGGADLILGLLICQTIILPIMWKPAGMGVNVLRSRIDPTLVKGIAALGVPLAVGNISGWLLSLGDRYVLEIFRGSTEVGIYSASYGISENSLVVLSALFALVSGSLVYRIYEKEGKEACRKMLTTLTRYYIIAALPFAVLLSVLAKPLVSLMFKESYRAGYAIMPLVVSGAFFLGLQQRYHAGIIIAKKNSIITLSVIVAGIVNVGLNLIFVPRYGYMAAGVNTLVSYIVLTVFIVPLSRRHFTWTFPFASLARTAAASAVMGALVFISGKWIPDSFFGVVLRGLIGIAVFTGAILLLGEFSLSRRAAKTAPPR